MLADVIDLLACPHCESALDLDDNVVMCDRGHSFDVARQGYVSLLAGGSTPFTGDTADMIAARADFLGAGHYDPIRRAVADACVDTADAVDTADSVDAPADAAILEVGAGTGQYLASVLDALPAARGIGLDVSKPAVRRIARSHPRTGAILADAWQRLPVKSASLTHVLSVFAPRNAAESHRVLAPGGTLVVATPTSEHLRELVALPGMVSVDDRKTERLSSALSGRFERAGRTDVRFTAAFPREALGLVAGMGPSAHHVTSDRRAELLASLPDPFDVTVSVTVTTWRRVGTADEPSAP
ncbi:MULTISPECIES: putative RNA methyltransferase [Rhodococcus]|uniref:Methyltransferase domain-containing protein n=1 Tax=Rhodococcus rhodochrous TaxID=1829 RepID=A0AAW4XHB4_RHORH|nr:methyltransferase domain-containing protein [Rhodococcus rhodochrous]MCD2112007.1 methyltransferase domain-containing protein [Rhodococcus rhodochrous]QHG84514.1 methyltransferase domain-containing protein [Rhodococcus rhodochrous]QOH55749.1 methyltransferase type 11 [Rhodococcus rhodochrous]